MFKIVDGSPIQWDASLNFLISNTVTLGTAYRLDSALSFLAGFQMSEKLFVGLGYDYSTTILKDFNDAIAVIQTTKDVNGNLLFSVFNYSQGTTNMSIESTFEKLDQAKDKLK